MTDLFWIPMLAFQTRSYLVSWSQGIFAVGSNRSSYSRQKTNNKSDSDCNIGIQVRTRSHTSWQTAEVPLHVCGKCEKCMAGKFCVTSNTMTHFFFFFLATVLLFCLHVSVCCCLRQLLEASLCTLWIMEVLGLYFSEPSSMVGGGVHTVEHKSS